MKLYMIRHGESMANLNRLHAGWSSTPLSSQGETQAKYLADTLKNYHFDKVYCSDLLRARQTKELALPHSEAILTDLLREISVGELAGKSADACLKEYGERYLSDKAVHDFRPYGGENREMHKCRVHRFLQLLEQQRLESVAAFCHEGTIRCALEKAGEEQAYKIPLKNTGVYLLEYVEGAWVFRKEVDG